MFKSDLKYLSLHGSKVCPIYSKNSFLSVFVSGTPHTQFLPWNILYYLSLHGVTQNKNVRTAACGLVFIDSRKPPNEEICHETLIFPVLKLNLEIILAL